MYILRFRVFYLNPDCFSPVAEGGGGVVPPDEVIYETRRPWAILGRRIQISMFFFWERGRLGDMGVNAPKLSQNVLLLTLSLYFLNIRFPAYLALIIAQSSLLRVLFRLQVIALHSGIPVPPKWGQQSQLVQNSLRSPFLMHSGA